MELHLKCVLLCLLLAIKLYVCYLSGINLEQILHFVENISFPFLFKINLEENVLESLSIAIKINNYKIQLILKR